MEENESGLVLLERAPLNPMFKTNDDGMFNASSLAKEYGKDVYGYTRSQKSRDLIKQIAVEYGHAPEKELSDQGNVVRVITGGLTPGTWMHLDIFIEFLGWLDSKLKRDFMRVFASVNQKQEVDPLQAQLATLESQATSLRRKLARDPNYKELLQVEKSIKRLHRDIDRESKAKRKDIAQGAIKQVVLIGNGKQQ